MMTSQNEHAGPKANILLVDDEPANLLALRAMLDDLGQNLVEARSGEEALKRLLQEDFAVVLLDVQMEGLDGFETAKLIRQREKNRHTPIVFLTAYDNNRLSAEEAYRFGAVDYLVKPLVPVILKAKVAGFVELFLQAEQINRQAERIRQMERREFEQKLADENARLRESEQRFARFMHQLPGLAWIKDLQGRYVYVNDAAEHAFRTPRAELYGKTDPEFLPPDIAAQFQENDRRALAAGKGLQVMETLPDENGVFHHFVVSKFPILGPDGEVRFVGGVAVDVTDRLRAEEAEKAAQKQLHIVIDSMSAPVTRCSRDLIYLWVSKPYADWLGRSPDDIVGRPIREVLGQEAFEALRPHFERVLSGQQVRYEEEVNFRGVGRRWVSAVYTPTVDATGVPDGWVAVVLDIDARKRVEEALKEADRRKDEFLAMLAHELRNPLAPLRNALHILKQPGVEATVRERVRTMMERQVQHLSRLVDDLLDVSRITRGKIDLRKEVVNLATLVHRTLEAIRPLLDERQHTLTVSLPPEPIRLEADPTRLEQVLANLLHNAAKYTERGGRIEVQAQHQGNEVLLRVRDTGIGIPTDMLGRIFEPFVQSDRRLEQSQGGLGIGLTLVRSLVAMHGGTVEAHSDGPGRGSEFVVRLPTLSGHEKPGGVRTATAPSAGSIPPQRVLVVDDNPDAAESLALLLRLDGHAVRVAHDGPTALAAVETEPPDVVFLDIGMPVMDGYAVARRIRQQPCLGQVRLVALTGWGQEDDRRRSQEAGFDAHLVKPADPRALQHVLAGGNVPAAGSP